MRTGLERVAASALVVAGMLAAAGYLLAVLLASDRSAIASDWGSLAAFALAGLALGVGWFAALRAKRHGGASRLRVPSFAVGAALFFAAVGAGFALAFWGVGSALTPLLAATAFAGVALVFLRLGVFWLSGRRIALDELVYPGLWGAIAAPLLLIPIQALAAAGLVFGALAGAHLGDPDALTRLDLGQRIEDYAQANRSSTSTALPDILTTPTGVFGLFAMLAVVAPVTEELIKALGAVLLLNRRPSVTEQSAFLAAVSAGLGFAVVEGLGYSLIDPLRWHQVALFRAPVVIIHVAATTIVVLGWQRMRERGGYGLMWYYLVAVALHAAWNGLFVAVLLVAASVDTEAQPRATEAVALLALVAGLGAILLAAATWMVLNARRIGRGDGLEDVPDRHRDVQGIAPEYPRAGVPAS